MKKLVIQTFKVCALLLGLIVLSCAIITPAIFLKTRPYIYEQVTNVPESQAIVIMGAAVLKDGGLSAVLKDRVDSALELYHAHKASKILVTGQNSSPTTNEVIPVRNYLIGKGVPEKDIFLDHAGVDTYSSMYRAREIFGLDSMIIVSQAFHLPRAVYLAQHFGIHAVAFNADRGHYTIYNYLREVPADVKAVIDIFYGRTPKFLGKQIDISGDGAQTLQ